MAAKEQVLLFSWGANNHGQLGQGHEIDKNEPDVLNFLLSKNTSLEKITGGGSHTTLLDCTGHVYTCGLNEKGQNGYENTDEKEFNSTLKLVRELTTHIVKDIACGWDFTIVVTDTGSVFSWGANTFSQLGIEENISQSKTPVKIKSLDGKNVLKIGAGLRHAVAISEEFIWVWGENRKGQCDSINSSKIIKTPLEIHSKFEKSNGSKIKSVSCGSYHSIIVLNSGDCYGWGSNNKGQLAFDPTTNPKKPLALTKLSIPCLFHVYCGWTHNVGITVEDCRVITWGRGDYGQLGRPCPSWGFDYIPKIIQIDDQVTKVCCGSEHSMVLAEEGKLYTWGWNEHGMCGMGNEDNVFSPTLIPYFKNKIVLDLGSGGGHSICVVENKLNTNL